jgi:hypothetical protein
MYERKIIMFDEHQVVETTVPILKDGHYIPEETSGVIVHIYEGGKAYEVEFPMIKYNPVLTCEDHVLTEAVNE